MAVNRGVKAVYLDFPFIWLAGTESMSARSFTKNNTQSPLMA